MGTKKKSEEVEVQEPKHYRDEFGVPPADAVENSIYENAQTGERQRLVNGEWQKI